MESATVCPFAFVVECRVSKLWLFVDFVCSFVRGLRALGLIVVGGKIVHQRVKDVVGVGHWRIALEAKAGGGRRRYRAQCE